MEGPWRESPGRQRRFRAARRALWAVAGGVAPALLLAALLVPDHAEESVRAEARAAAALAAEATEAAWEAELAQERPFGLADPLVARAEPPATEDASRDEVERLRDRVAVAEMADAPDAAARLAGEVERGGRTAAPALVALARAAAAAGADPAGEAARLLGTALACVGFDAEADGLPARPLALVVAANALDRAALRAELSALHDALAREEVVPRDAARLGPGGALAFTPDPTWVALEEALAARIAWTGVGDAFAEDLRRRRAYARTLLAAPPRSGAIASWRVHETDDPARIALARRTGDGAVALHEVEAGALERLLRRASRPRGTATEWGWLSSITAPGAPPPADAFATTAALAGTTRRATLTPQGLPRRIAAADRQVLALRLAGAVAAIALAVAALAVLRTLARTEELLRLRSTFVASVSHDLRTPVASIGLLAGNLRAGHVPEGRRAQYADAIEREAARLGRLVDDLLDFGRVERGLPARVRRERVALRPWLEGFAAAERAKCAARDRSLGVTIGDLPPAADLDRHALERAVSNLVDNALAHSGSERIELRASAEGDALRLDVLDEGSGARETRLEALFEPFARGAAAGDDRSAAAGTGLGLAIVRAVAEAHGGRASLERRPDGAGMRARVEVPLANAEDAA